MSLSVLWFLQKTHKLIQNYRMTKCHFGLYGGSGTLQKFDALCVLGMNIINEKVIRVSTWDLYIILFAIPIRLMA